jgi:conjugative relaxase-like TrwC/TraI family protein
MSMARLSAGSGYRYLLRHTAVGDAARVAGQELTAYYAATGNPAGRWLGAGLVGLTPGEAKPALVAGAVVAEEAMAALYGAGNNPVTGEQLGRPYPAYKNAESRIAEAIAGLPETLSPAARDAAAAGIEARVKASPTRSAVAGFDLTFTVPKSASVLWALGDKTVQVAVADAHREAVDAVLGMIEDRFLFTRTGTNSCMQVDTRGLIAAGFDHYDTRTGDPNLHTHVVIANKVQGPDGVWRSVDAQVLYRAAVACSEVYDTLLADGLATRLPVTWSPRDRGPRRTPGFEIDGIDDDLLAAFSGRSRQIGTGLVDLVAGFTATRGREPSRVEMLRLRQQATLATRPTKHVHTLTDLRAGWASTATAVTGRSGKDLVAAAIQDDLRTPEPLADAPEAIAATLDTALAETVLTSIQVRRSTWTKANLLAEAARATRHLRLASPQSRLDLLDRVVDAALAGCVGLEPPAVFHSPARFRRLDGASVFDRAGDEVFTTTAVLDAEARLLAALQDTTAPVVPAAVTAPLDRPLPGQRVAPDQHAAVVGIAGSGRCLDVLVGPAGTGKTNTLALLTRAWVIAHGAGSVIGLAPSAAAAFELGTSLGIACETTAKWLHDRTVPDTTPAGSYASPRAGMIAGGPLEPGTLVIVDEASLASTAHLDALLGHVGTAGAKLLLVGDDHQLDAVDAGGAFALLVETATETHCAHALDALWRFTNRWEARATRDLRVGNPAALDAYAQHGRLREGDTDTMAEAAYRAWCHDLADGKHSLLIAPDRDTVTALNLQARADRVAVGQVAGPGVALTDTTACAPGDWITTRQNDRRLPVPGGGHVRNGASWTVTAVHADGSIDVVAREHAARPAKTQPAHAQAIRLPARYVADHVELGYATTIHRAQGATVDTTHVVVRAGLARQSLYVAMTRGRHANHAYVAVDGFLEPEDHHSGEILTGRQVLEKALATDGSEQSATAILRARQDRSTSPRRLTAIREALRSGATEPTTEAELAASADELTRLLALRAARERTAARTTAGPGYALPAPARRGPDPISR